MRFSQYAAITIVSVFSLLKILLVSCISGSTYLLHDATRLRFYFISRVNCVYLGSLIVVFME